MFFPCKKLRTAVLCGVMAALLPLSIASAGIGGEIGVSFPVGTSRSSSNNAVGYAAFSNQAIAQELTVEELRGGIRMELTVTNGGDEAYTIENATTQLYDFCILDKDGTLLYRWSDGKSFAQTTTTLSVAAHGVARYSVELPRQTWRKIRNKAVTFTATLTHTPFTLSARLPQKATGSASPVYIHGGVIVGSGRYLTDMQEEAEN